MDFERSYVSTIEQAFETQASLRGRWHRLASADSNPSAKARKAVVAWKIEIPPNAVKCPNVDELWVLLDDQFPYSQPRVLAPSLREDSSNWPHIEDAGLLCLPSTGLRDCPGFRVLRHLEDALQLLNLEEADRKRDFQSEFATYWARGDAGKPLPGHWSLATPGGPSREVFRYHNLEANRYIWADTKPELEHWLRNAGRNPSKKSFESAWAVWLSEAPTPAQFPRLGSHVLALIPPEAQARLIRPGEKLPILMGAPTTNGPVWVVAILDIASERDLQSGFRNGRIPFDRAKASMAARPVRRLKVERLDGSYVHGRDRNEQYKVLSRKRVAIIGCGSLGSSIAKLLAQGGVGSFLTIDDDIMAAHNTSRHSLGSKTIGFLKADALADSIEADFPHQGKHARLKKRVENMTRKDWEEVAACDLIVSAGIDFPGDMRIAAWRRSVENPPPHVCTWVEAFAVVGHAVALFGRDELGALFDADGKPQLAMTHWPDTTPVLFREAGCGNSFQPHGAVDLQRTATTAATLCLDILLGTVANSCRRTWQGDLTKLASLGGAPSADFRGSNTESFWPWAALASASSG